jgi:hypothetical protein
MSYGRVFLSVVAVLSLPLCCPAQQAPVRDAQGVLLLQRSLAALAGTTGVSDLSASGTARRIAGSDDETGTGVLKATADGRSRIDLAFPSGRRAEFRDSSGGLPIGTRSGPGGASQEMALHNLWTDPTWFYPAFLMGRALGTPSYGISHMGDETSGNGGVEHVRVWQQTRGLPAGTSQQLSQVDLYLDASSGLPIAEAFATHPDTDAGLDIGIEIRFSDYRPVRGAQVPFRVQKYLNNGLVLDLRFGTVALNTGLTAAFEVQ